MALVVLSCSTNNDIQTADLKGGNGKHRTLMFRPEANTALRLATGRIMEEPVEYTGDLTGIEPTVDWDNDGTIDNFQVNERCYFPRTFQDITVNGTPINYSATYKTNIVGFKDVDGDGYKDAIMRGGRSIAYNDPNEPLNTAPYWDETTSYNVGDYVRIYEQCCAPTTYYCTVANTGVEPNPDSPFWRYALNVGYNREGTVTPLKDIVQSLVISSSANNPNYIQWDLSDYGIHNFTFHVYLIDKTSAQATVQTTTYGEWGFYTGGRLIPGDVYVLRFTNLGDDCSDVDVEFSL